VNVPDRDVNLAVNLQPGQDALTPALARLKESADELSKALADMQIPAPKTPLSAALTAAPPRPAPAAPPATSPGRGRVPAAGAASSLAGALGGTLSGNVAGAAGSVASALGSLGGAAGIAAPVVGALGAGVGAVTALVVVLDQAFRRFRPSIAELTEELERSRGTTNRVRQTGVATASDLRDALRGTEAGEAQEAQAGGNMGGFRSVLQRALRRNQREAAQLSTVNTGQMQSEVQAVLDEVMEQQRGQGGQLNASQRTIQTLRLRQIYSSRGLSAYMPAELENLQNNLTPQQARNLAEAGGTGLLARRQANVLTLQTALSGISSGLAPNLRPGAPGLADLPGIFQSRQTDFLELHGQIQQEVVRDQREQQRFEAQMRLWEEISRNIAVMAGAPGASGPTLADTIMAALEGLFGAG
jgi:hypothetical protein